MIKKLMISAAIAGLTIGSAFAQGNTPPAASAPAPAASSSATPAPSGSAPTATPATPAKFINSQRSDQFLASKFKGTDVIGTDDKKIGDVSDILFDKDGKIEAYVIGVGGVLGIGAKDVALAPAAFQVIPGDQAKNEPDKLRLSMTKDELKQAANFEPYKAPSSTTGMGGSTTSSRPLSPATHPAPAPK